VSAAAKPINTVRKSEQLRASVIDLAGRRLLISQLAGSEQEGDLRLPANCNGYGRIHHFKQETSKGWPLNPLPIGPACKALGLAVPPMMTAQVFQNAACAWRCWYCFVPYNLLAADPKRSAWFTPEELVRLYRAEQERPKIIDLSGGTPDLVPEWTLWMMEALASAGLDQETFLWTDDNLSTRYLFEKLTPAEISRMATYQNYGRVCCFKGYDAASFAFNTRAAEQDFDGQLAIMGEVLAIGFDVYGYITLTGPTADGLPSAMDRFFDRLQDIDPNLPLRIVPLEIREFSPVISRMTAERRHSLVVQDEAIVEWNAQIQRRFDEKLRSLDIANVPIRARGGAGSS
jgi:uncharacterized Fe-S cluster-containing radical SAM superfamily protein